MSLTKGKFVKFNQNVSNFAIPPLKWLILMNLSLKNRPYKWRKKCEQRSRPHLTCNIWGLVTVRFITPNTFRRVGLRASWRQSVTGKSGKFPGACHGDLQSDMQLALSLLHTPQHNTPSLVVKPAEPSQCKNRIVTQSFAARNIYLKDIDS